MSRLIVIGDSHSRALALGARAQGFETLAFSTSEGAWRDGSVSLEADGSLTTDRFRARQKIESFEAEVGQSPALRAGLPIIASLGFHIPEFITQMRWHKLGCTLGAPKSARSLISPAFLRAWMSESREDMIDALGVIAIEAPLVIVVPPLFARGPLISLFKDELKALITARGLTVFDPNEELGDDTGKLPERYLHEDGRHGNEAFGSEVVKALLKRKLIDTPAKQKSA